MKKLNNKGFAITSILYSIMVLFLMLLLSILGILGSRKAILDKNKKDILDDLNSEVLNNKFNFEHRNITIINRGNADDIVYALMDGVTAVDENGNQISSENISYNLDVNNIENETYTVTYTANNNGKTIIGTRKITFTDDDIVSTFSYKDEAQEFIPSYNGSYKVELWGAQGGGEAGGRGAYTQGILNLDKNNTIYAYVGGNGQDISGYEIAQGGYNGGGNSYGDYNENRKYGSGGGASDIRITSGIWNEFDGLKNRIMVAAGGGGSFYESVMLPGGEGGSIHGNSGNDENGIQGWGSAGTGATQTAGGYSICDDITCNELLYSSPDAQQGILNNGKFGYANEYGIHSSTGAGGGYYGGGGAVHVQSSGGGSSFISGYDGCDAIAEESTEDNIIHTGQSIHYSGYKFNNAVMYAGNESMPTHDGTSTMIGNSGDGYAKISLIYYY